MIAIMFIKLIQISIISNAINKNFIANLNAKTYPSFEYPLIENKLIFPKFSMTDLMREINNLNVKKSIGNSIILAKVIKNCPAFVKILFILYNHFVDERKIPEKLKM